MLSEDQALSVEVTDEQKMIIAIAGAGKTFTITFQANKTLSADPKNELLMVTFTKDATAEMLNRTKAQLDASCVRRLTVRTFSSIMLQQFNKYLKKGRELIMGEGLTSYIRRAMISTGLNTDDLRTWATRLNEVGRELEWEDDGTPISQLRKNYHDLLRRVGKLDTNMMAVELIQGINSGTVPLFKYTHIICDEFQDTDNLQFEWLKAHALKGTWVTVVGDDDQSIYGWRGSKGYFNFVRFQKELEANAYLLGKCYRCPPVVLGAAQRLIEHNENRIQKDMVSDKDYNGELLIYAIPKGYKSEYSQRLMETDSVEIQTKSKVNLDKVSAKRMEGFRFVAENIKKDWGKWAVLGRTNKQLDLMELALNELQIEYIKLGGRSIFENEHAIGIANLFHGLINNKQATSLEVGLGWLGESEKVIIDLFKTTKSMGFSAASQMGGDWKKVTIQLHAHAEEWQKNSTPNSEMVIAQFESTLKAHINRKSDKDKNFQLSVLDVCMNVLKASSTGLHKRVDYLLDKVSNLKKEKVDHKSGPEVVLTTVNGAKGLEWPNVWIVEVEKEKFPSVNKDDLSDSNIEEERNLGLVALTRAEEKAVVSFYEGKESQFIDEMM